MLCVVVRGTHDAFLAEGHVEAKFLLAEMDAGRRLAGCLAGSVPVVFPGHELAPAARASAAQPEANDGRQT